MRTRRRPTPPADANELLDVLRAGRLLSRKQIRRLVFQWSESRPDEPDDPAAGTRLRALELVDAGLMTRWQVEQLLAGHGRRLRLGHYRLPEWLGAGGMGSVYKAEHRLMKRIVALKVLGRPRAEAPWTRLPSTAVPRWRREVEAAARLSHPNIVAAYDAVRARGVLFLVMEYVEGVDLGRLVARGGAAARAAGVRGRPPDRPGPAVRPRTRPAPLRREAVEPAAGPSAAPALGRGSARRVERRPAARARQAAGHGAGPTARRPRRDGGDDLEGTPDYLAPKRGGGDPIDGRSDLYSLGCTFYHLLTGQPPFPGGDAAAKVLRHRLDAPAPVRACGRTCPHPWRRSSNG